MITSGISRPPALDVCGCLDGTHLNLDGAQVLTDIIGRREMFWRESCGLLLLLDAKCGLRACEMVTFELSEERQHLVVRQQR